MPKIQTGLRLDREIHDKLTALSQKENRTLNNLAEHIIKLYLQDYEATHGQIDTDAQSK